MSQTAAGIEERAVRVKEVRHDSSMTHDLQAPALFLSLFRHTIMSAAIVPRLTALYMFPCLSGREFQRGSQCSTGIFKHDSRLVSTCPFSLFIPSRN
jgi:hypothetical protein